MLNTPGHEKTVIFVMIMTKMNYSDPKVAQQMRARNLKKIVPFAFDMGRVGMNPDRNMLSRVKLFDTSGRDGMQMYRAYANMNQKRTESKVMVVERLMKWGMPVIEVGYPGSSKAEFKAASKLVRMRDERGIPTIFVGLAGTIKEHVKAAKEAGMDEVHIFSSGSIAHAYTKFGKMPEELVAGIVDAVKYARQIGFAKIVVSLEDAFSADPDFVAKVAILCKEAAGSAQFRYNIPDTIGVANNAIAYAFTRYIIDKTNGEIPLDVHFHNDAGCAATNSIWAVLAGAQRIQGTMNGLGERAGNSNFNEIFVQLFQHYGVIPVNAWGQPLDIRQLTSVANYIAELSGIPLPQNAVGVGSATYAHGSGIHANGYWKSVVIGGAEHSIYVPVNPAVFGNEEIVVRGPLAGKSSHMVALLNYFKLDVNNPDIQRALERDKMSNGQPVLDEDKNVVREGIVATDKILSARRHVSDAEYILNVYYEVFGRECNVLQVDYDRSEVKITGKGGDAIMVVTTKEAERLESSATGNGPVNAAVRALEKAIGDGAPKMVKYNNRSIGGGSDASAEVELTVQNGGRPIETSCIGGNTVIIAIQAYVQAYNALHALSELQAQYGKK